MYRVQGVGGVGGGGGGPALGGVEAGKRVGNDSVWSRVPRFNPT